MPGLLVRITVRSLRGHTGARQGWRGRSRSSSQGECPCCLEIENACRLTDLDLERACGLSRTGNVECVRTRLNWKCRVRAAISQRRRRTYWHRAIASQGDASLRNSVWAKREFFVRRSKLDLLERYNAHHPYLANNNTPEFIMCRRSLFCLDCQQKVVNYVQTLAASAGTCSSRGGLINI